MSGAWVVTMTFAAVGLLVVALVSAIDDLFLRYRTLLSDRLEELSGKRRFPKGREALFKDPGEQDDEFIHSWRGRLERTIDQTGIGISLARLSMIAVGLGISLAVATVAASGWWWTAPLAFVLGVGTISVYVLVKRRARLQRLMVQLPRALDVMGRAVRAGQTVPAAIQIVAADLQSPISSEFRYCYEQQRLGMSYETALRKLAQRTGIMELRILVVALLVHSRSGGNLVEVLNNLSGIVKQRLKLQLRVNALTGEGRLQAKVLMVLPFVAFGILLIVAPQYVSTLLDRPWILAATVVAQLLGALWIQRVVRFEY